MTTQPIWPSASALLEPLGPWFDRQRRDLPWRDADLNRVHPNPYAVLVSELMLQQTQVTTVIPFFHRWMAQFPTPEALASASEDAIHKAWEGLGYYRRARFLQDSAKVVAQEGWPEDLEGLLELPGLGPYTAAAVASIAFQWPEPALDGNAFRVLARLLALEGDPKGQAALLRTWLRPALVAYGPSRLTQALMELGATTCGPAPRCEACPLTQTCVAFREGLQRSLPMPTPRAAPKRLTLRLLAIEAEGSFLLRPPTKKGLLAGLWTWPTQAPNPDRVAEDFGSEKRTWPGWTQVYTHRREEVEPVHLDWNGGLEPPEGLVWIPKDRLASLPMGSRDARLRTLLGIEVPSP